MRGETRELNAAERLKADGSFIRLQTGITHFELGNPQNENTIVLIHGFSVPYFIFDPTFEFLVQSGYRTLRYDLFGRGYSDRPQARYDMGFFVNQLGDLLNSLRITFPVTLIGLSMGGPIAASFAARSPTSVKKLVLIDPTGARPIELSPYLRAAKIPFLAEAVLNLLGGEFLIESVARDFFDPALVNQFQSRYKIQMQYKGFGRAILSTIRCNMLGGFPEVYKKLGDTLLPILVLWGRQDSTVPFEHSLLMRDLLTQAEFHIIENCGHIPHYEKADEVNPILKKFLGPP